MGRKTAWFLNFDADDELARPRGYTPARASLARWGALREATRALVGPGDVVIEEGQSSSFDNKYTGVAWCPTPRALRALGRAGAPPRPSPPIDVLRAVNSRRFCAELGQTLPGALYALSTDDVERALAGQSPTGQWLLKRPFGFAGRGRLRLDATKADERARAQSWIAASLRAGEGLQVEPWVERAGDFGLHGYVRRSGEVALGEPTRQECDASGAWVRSERAADGELSNDERAVLLEAVLAAAERLHRAGYFGPFGVDAFRYHGPRSERLWNPRCEINARYSMGWAIGMGALRPDLEELAEVLT